MRFYYAVAARVWRFDCHRRPGCEYHRSRLQRELFERTLIFRCAQNMPAYAVLIARRRRAAPLPDVFRHAQRACYARQRPMKADADAFCSPALPTPADADIVHADVASTRFR